MASGGAAVSQSLDAQQGGSGVQFNTVSLDH